MLTTSLIFKMSQLVSMVPTRERVLSVQSGDSRQECIGGGFCVNNIVFASTHYRITLFLTHHFQVSNDRPQRMSVEGVSGRGGSRRGGGRRVIGCVLPPAATSHANNNQLGGGETVPQFHCLLTKNPSHQPFPSPNKRMLTRSRRNPALSAQEKRYLERQRRQRKPTKSSSSSGKKKTSKTGRHKREPSPSSSVIRKKPS